MALQTSGPISLNDIHVEAGGSSGTNCTINDTDIRDLIGKGSGATMSFNEWYGASSVQSFTISTEGSYGQYRGVDLTPNNQINFGAFADPAFTDASGNSRDLYQLMTNGVTYLYFGMLDDSPTGASAFHSVTVNAGGTNYTFLRSDAYAQEVFTTSGSERVRWYWYATNTGSSLSLAMSAVYNELDGTGTTSFTVETS